MIGWDRYGDDWYIWIDELDLTHAVSAVAHYRITGPGATITPDIVQWYGKPRLHVNVPQAPLPSGTEVQFWLDVTFDDTSTVRVPAGTDTLSVIVWR